MTGSVKVQGLNALIKDLQSFGVEVTDLKAAFRSIATRGAQTAESLAPRRTGTLARSIRGRATKNRALISAGGARVPYAGAINYGWRRRGIRASRFMQRADAAIAPDAVREIDAELTRLLADRGLS